MMTREQAQKLKEENAIRDRVNQAIASTRITRLENLISNYKDGHITAGELLGLTDSLLQDEFKQALGR